ncbi:MAG TPA: type III polyketide synthase [Micromonosporaceae bacterium]|nr:type III polyketide synthase [Micromonosporaceae bacterium]
MGARILALRAATPTAVVPQDEVFAEFYRDLYADIPNAKDLFAHTQVRRRHMAWDPRVEFGGGFPGMACRMRAWEEHALALGRRCLDGVLAGVDTGSIGTFTMASCTGYAGPTPEMLLAKEFGLPERLRRTFVGHMGCYAAFNALKVALDGLAARPSERALVLCAEVCSVHARPEATVEQAVVHALFGDAAVALLLGDRPGDNGPRIVRTHTVTHYPTAEAMTWRIEDDAFRMTLSPYVPAYLAGTIRPFVEELLEPAGLGIGDVQHWAIHPGGPKIVEFVGERLGLAASALAPSLAVLAEYGNCSSTTVLLILDRIIVDNRPGPGEYAVLMAFGPGLTMESALVEFPGGSQWTPA